MCPHIFSNFLRDYVLKIRDCTLVHVFETCAKYRGCIAPTHIGFSCCQRCAERKLEGTKSIQKWGDRNGLGGGGEVDNPLPLLLVPPKRGEPPSNPLPLPPSSFWTFLRLRRIRALHSFQRADLITQRNGIQTLASVCIQLNANNTVMEQPQLDPHIWVFEELTFQTVRRMIQK